MKNKLIVLTILLQALLTLETSAKDNASDYINEFLESYNNNDLAELSARFYFAESDSNKTPEEIERTLTAIRETLGKAKRSSINHHDKDDFLEIKLETKDFGNKSGLGLYIATNITFENKAVARLVIGMDLTNEKTDFATVGILFSNDMKIWAEKILQ